MPEEVIPSHYRHSSLVQCIAVAVHKQLKRTIRKAHPRGFPRLCKNAAQLILNVKNCFKYELDRRHGISFYDVTERVIAATGLSRPILCQFTTQKDVDQYNAAKEDKRQRDMIVPKEFIPIIRHCIRYLIIDKKTNPTLDKITETVKNGEFN